ncbi:hypothetical protein ACHAP5_004966 [Fusarium lateritium]
MLAQVPQAKPAAACLVETTQANLECDAAVIERGNSLCRAKANGGGLFVGGRIIQNLDKASVN